MDSVQLDEEAVFDVARKITDREARAAYLAQVCGGDAALARRVERLVRVGEQEAGFLVAAPCDATVDLPAEAERPGVMVGPYKLLEPIGEGGMGTVYMAEQTHPVRRKVALKVIKPGMDSKPVVARFESERQALALMDHPNIARVLDAGATDTGRPYFVMELVRGVPITAYCDREQLPVAARLELFVLVCRAVQHAHQKGVIHRDLKPSNILVTMHDGAPVPKVIDFGIAKATGQALTEKTLFTGFAQLVGTPLYMSPEQAEMSGLDIDTRSDIYSLGVLLYELLTGTTPFDSETLKKAAFDEMRRIIREQEPQRPSTRLSSLGETLTTVSARRGSDPRHLNRSVRGELDWITMKALEKDRCRRYETANDFAADILNYLADRPVEACPPSARYRLGKFARGHRVALTTAALVGTALVAGAAVSAWQAVRATRAGTLAVQRGELAARKEREAQTAAEESKAVLQFLVRDMLGASEIENSLGRDVKVSEVLANAEKKVEGAFPGRPLVEAGVRHALAVAFDSQGRHDDARRHDARSLDLRRSALGPEHPDTLTSAAYLAYFLLRLGRTQEARELNERTLEARRRVLGEEHADTLFSMNNQVYLLQDLGELDEARTLGERALQARRRTLGPEHRDTLQSTDVLATTLRLQGKLDEARMLAERALEVRRRVLGADHPDSLGSMNNLSLVLQAQGKLDETLRLREGFLEAGRRVFGAEHPNTLAAMINLANLLFTMGREGEALPMYRRALDAQLRVLGPDHPQTLLSMENLAIILGSRQEHDEARKLRERLLEGRRRSLGPEHRDTLNSMHELADTLASLGRHDEARRLAEEALEIRRRTLGPEHPETLVSMNRLSIVFFNQGKRDEALALRERLVAAQRRQLGPDHRAVLSMTAQLADEYAAGGRSDRARVLHEQAFEARRRTLGPGHPQTLSSMYSLAQLLLTPADAPVPDRVRALDLARKATEGDPNQQLFWKWLGVAEYANGHWDAAIEATERGIKVRGDDGWSFLWLVLAVAHERRGETDLAREWYAKARPSVEAGDTADAPRWLVDEAKARLGTESPPAQ